MSRCDKCGKETDRIYGMTNGEFYCRDCANIPDVIIPHIDRDTTWKLRSFVTSTADPYFDRSVNEFLRTEHPSEIHTEFASNDKGTLVLLIFYK